MQSKTQIFIEKAQKIHGIDKYEYSMTVYINSRTKVNIKCKNCNMIFQQRPDGHLSGYNCKQCSIKSYSEGTKKSLDQFIIDAKIIHGNKYDYSDSIYNGASNKLIIKCNKCQNKFEQTGNSHLKGSGCKLCSIQQMKQKTLSTTEQFIEKAKKIHQDDRYDYTNCIYTGSKNKVILKCNKCHSEFQQIADTHLQGSGCDFCANKERGIKRKYTTQQFIDQAIQIHENDRYDYSLVDYKKSISTIKIICNRCKQIFEQVAKSHLEGKGCFTCGRQDSSDKTRYSNEDFIDICKKIHGDKYDYSLTDYTISTNKITIICKSCNMSFQQKAQNHSNGSGCGYCKNKTEKILVQYLQSKYDVQLQKQFDDLISSKGRNLRFDAYLPQFNLAIECDGIQHIQQVSVWNCQDIQQHDLLKEQYCIKNKINLLRMSQYDIWNNEVKRPNSFNWRDIITQFIEQIQKNIHIIQKIGITMYND